MLFSSCQHSSLPFPLNVFNHQYQFFSSQCDFTLLFSWSHTHFSLIEIRCMRGIPHKFKPVKFPSSSSNKHLTDTLYTRRALREHRPSPRPNALSRNINNSENNLCIHPLIQICSKMYWVHLWPMLHPSTKFHENQACSFSIILLTN